MENKIKCSVCLKKYSPSSIMFGETISTSTFSFIQKDKSDFQRSDLICLNCLNHYRSQYIQSILEDEKGKLSELEREVISSIREQDIISENINIEIAESLTFADKVADKVAEFGGSWKFIIFFAFFLLLWMSINLFILATKPFDYIYQVPSWLRRSGTKVHIVTLPFWHSIHHRVQELEKQLKDIFPGERINLLGHSMGGLDARFFTSQIDRGERVLSVTTVGTPNKGTAIADHLLDLFLENILHKTEGLMKKLHLSNQGLLQMTKKYFHQSLQQEMQNINGVKYFSAATVIKRPVILNSMPIFWSTYHLLEEHEGANDGFVSEESARWGEHICTYEGDHYAQIGHFLGMQKMDHISFYKEIFSRLQKEGL